MNEPRRCFYCKVMAKVGTPGTVKIRKDRQHRPVEVTVSVPMCSACIMKVLEDTGPDTAPIPIYNTEGKPLGPAVRLGANPRPSKWLGNKKRRRPK